MSISTQRTISEFSRLLSSNIQQQIATLALDREVRAVINKNVDQIVQTTTDNFLKHVSRDIERQQKASANDAKTSTEKKK